MRHSTGRFRWALLHPSGWNELTRSMGDTVKVRGAPTRISLPFGKTPAPTFPILRQAKAEYEKLQ